MVERIKSLIDEDTPLGEIPRDWLIHIEPKIVRGAFRPCWIWDGTLDGQGYPRKWETVRGKKKPISVRHLIAKIFWSIKGEFYVKTACGVSTCVNPAHFIIKERR